MAIYGCHASVCGNCSWNVSVYACVHWSFDQRTLADRHTAVCVNADIPNLVTFYVESFLVDNSNHLSIIVIHNMCSITHCHGNLQDNDAERSQAHKKSGQILVPQKLSLPSF